VRDALAELIRAAGLVRRIGNNLNQAVARLNATGQPSADLVPYAAESIRRAGRLDAIAEQVRNALRVTSAQAMTPSFRAVERLPVHRKAARNAFRLPARIIRSGRMAFRGGWRIIQDGRNAWRIAFWPGRMAG